MPEKYQKIAVIAGLEENGLGVARALFRENISSISLATPEWNPACQTNATRVVYCREWNKEEFINSLVQIGSRLEKKAPLIITKDEPVLWVSEAREILSEYYEIALPEKSVIDLLMSKSLFMALALEEGWPYPKTWMVDTEQEFQDISAEIEFPCIIKPQIKNEMFRRYSPAKAYKIFEIEELRKIYRMIAQWEKEVIIQEWIDGGDDRISFCLTYYNQARVPLALFAGRKLRQYPIECGNTAICEPAPREWSEAIIKLTEKIFKKVNYVGLGSVEYKMKMVNDSLVPIIMEPTVGRTNYQNEIAVLNGQNIPAVAYFDMAHGKRFPVFCNLNECKLIDNKNDLKSSWQYFKQDRLSLKNWIASRSGKKVYMIYRKNDLGPTLGSLIDFLKNVVMKIIRIPARLFQSKG